MLYVARNNVKDRQRQGEIGRGNRVKVIARIIVKKQQKVKQREQKD